ncbi:MAG TPA: ABC transporter ATP-binding protein [candidate division Zixibacteria bacterium]|nr:ABC transporter ATP-binding protein [candidate division Zixibacteria bacterium]
MSGLILKNISKSFDGRAVLKDVNLEFPDGELLVLLGPSGCGKSTLLRIIAGLETADAGEIYVSNIRIDQKEPKDRNVALVFQNYALYPHMTVEKNLAFPLIVARVPKEEIKERVSDVAAMLGLSDKLKERPGRLSGGERQRVALGRAIIREPAIFLLDEPLSNLDADLRGRMRREIVSLQKRLKKALIHVTHDQTEALTMADRIVLMNKGEIVQLGTPQDLYQNPNNLFTARFIGYPPINTFKSKQSNGLFEALELKTKSNQAFLSEECIVCIRPESIILGDKERFAGNIESCEYMGGQMLVKLAYGDISLTAVTSMLNLVPNDRVTFNILSEGVYLFDQSSLKRITNV